MQAKFARAGSKSRRNSAEHGLKGRNRSLDEEFEHFGRGSGGRRGSGAGRRGRGRGRGSRGASSSAAAFQLILTDAEVRVGMTVSALVPVSDADRSGRAAAPVVDWNICRAEGMCAAFSPAERRLANLQRHDDIHALLSARRQHCGGFCTFERH